MDQEKVFIAGFHNCNPAIWEKVYEHKQHLIIFALGLIKDRHEIEDIVMNAFMKLLKNRDRFTSKEHIRAFLFVTVKNDILKYLQRRIYQTAYTREITYQQIQQPDKYHQLKLIDIIEHLKPFLKSLSKTTRDIFLLRYYDGLDDQQIAGQLGTTVKTVYARNCETKKKLIKWCSENTSYLDLLFLSILTLLLYGCINMR
jgi:RNA polymerase sigma factor (sigma-70 family)